MYSKWKEEIVNEFAFWDEWISTGGSEWKEDYEMRLKKDTVISEELFEYIKDVGSPTILDVGAGPLTCLGKVGLNGKLLDITAVDPLANYYNKLLDKAGIIPPIRTQFGEAERLSDYFEPNSFDFVFMRNALDHTYNPVLALEQMIYVTKLSGICYLTHSANEGKKQGYKGLHQWNISIKNGSIYFWNSEEEINIEDIIGSYCEIVMAKEGNDMINFAADWVSFAIKKAEHRNLNSSK